MKRQIGHLLPAIGLGAIAFAGYGCNGKKAKEQKPNVIIIYADDVGIGDLYCYGTGVVPTPNVNRLAEEGIRFTNSHVTSATSTPSRYGMLTGCYPWRRNDTGIAQGDAAMIIRPEQTTIADLAKQSGYATAAIGKWHLGIGDKQGKQDWNNKITPGLDSIGFDYAYIMAATGDRVPCVYIENGRIADFDAEHPIEVSYSTPFEGEPTGHNNPERLKLHPSHGHDMAIVNGISRIGFMRGGGKALWRDEDIADRITDKAIQFITDNQEKPFFLYLGTNDIHVPRVPHERFVGKSGLGARGDAILEFDYTVGRILTVVDSLGLGENTMIILSSDNGPVVDDGYKDMAVELLGDHKPSGDYRGGKYSAFEAGTRVPMIVRWSGKTPKGVTSEQLFSHIDLCASLANLFGATIPNGQATDSRNAINTLLGKDDSERDCVIEQNTSGTLSIFDGEWKYISPSKADARIEATNTELGNLEEEQLYNLKEDRGERINLAAQHPEKVEKLKALLRQTRDGKQ